jgi:hypothetical protein
MTKLGDPGAPVMSLFVLPQTSGEAAESPEVAFVATTS